MAFASAVSLVPVPLISGGELSIAAALTAADGTNGNRFILNPNTFLRVKNGAGAPITVTVHTNRVIAGLTLPDDTFAVAATTGDVLYKFAQPIDIYWQAGTNEVWIEFSSATTVTVKVYEF